MGKCYGGVSGDKRSQEEFLIGSRRRKVIGEMEVGGRVVENKRCGAQGNGER